MNKRIIHAEVAIIGAGAAGYGALYSLVRGGVKTVVADENPDFGGNAVYSGVNCWEPGVTAGKLHRLLAEKLICENGVCLVEKSVPNSRFFYKNSDVNDFKTYP